MNGVGNRLPTVRAARSSCVDPVIRQRPTAHPRGDGPPVPWGPWSRAWLGALALAFVNAGLRQGYEGALGELRAEQVSSVVLLALLAPWVAHTDRRHPLPSGRAALVVGAEWGAATVVFELLFGHYGNGDPWADLLAAYDVLDGHLWPLVVVGMGAGPAAARWFRMRGATAPVEGR